MTTNPADEPISTTDPFAAVGLDRFESIASSEPEDSGWPDEAEEPDDGAPEQEPAGDGETPAPEAEGTSEEKPEGEETAAPEEKPATETVTPEKTGRDAPISIKFYGEKIEFDPYADVAETARLIQLGKDHEKKTGINDAISKGIVRYDLDTGGIVPGDAIVKKIEAAELKGATTILDKLAESGHVEKRDGRWFPVELPPKQEKSATSLEELERRALSEGTAEAVMAWQKAKDAAAVAAYRAQQQEASQKTSAENEIQQGLALADKYIDDLAKQLAPQFADIDGKPDQAVIDWAVKHAKDTTRLRDEKGTFQFDRARTMFTEFAKSQAAKTKAAMDRLKTTAPARPAPKKPTSTSNPASGPAKGEHGREFDPSQPFAHIGIDRLAAVMPRPRGSS